MASDGECSETERNDAIQAIIDLALARPQTPVGRRAAEWASFCLYGQRGEEQKEVAKNESRLALLTSSKLMKVSSSNK